MGGEQTRWVTYRELAVAMKINAASARRLVARNKQWPRRPGNDGLVRIGVPTEKLPRDDTHDVVDDPTRDVTHAPTHDAHDGDTHSVTGVVHALQQHIETLMAGLAKAEARADQLERDLVEARARAARVDRLEALLGAAEAERSRWHAAATARRSWWPWRRSA